MVATGPKGASTIYSSRFSYSGMKGKFSDAVVADLKKVTGTSGPANVLAGTDDQAAGASSAAPEASLFDVDYAMQTGATRYAPMQPLPGTKVTAKGAKPQYPTSSVPIAKTWLPIPSIQTTLTQSATHSVESRPNPVRLPLQDALLQRAHSSSDTILIMPSGPCTEWPRGRHGQIPGEMEGLDITCTVAALKTRGVWR
jgi:hypothetical protein